MKYVPEIDVEESKNIYKHFKDRLDLYRKKGLDFDSYREFILGKIAPIEGDILEIGTGNGYTALMLAKAGYKFTSVDMDKEALKTTALRLAYDNVLENAAFHVMDATELNFNDAYFNNVIAVNVLHHVEEINKLLSEADRVLKPGGKILISDFNEEGRRVIDAVHLSEGKNHDHPIADYGAILSFFNDKGYKTEELENTGHWIMIGQKKL